MCDWRHRFIKAGAKYDAVNKGSSLDRRDVISAERGREPSAVPVVSGSGRASPDGGRMFFLRRRSSQTTITNTNIAAATPPTTPPAILPLVWLLREPEPEPELELELELPEEDEGETPCPVAVAPDPPPPPFEAVPQAP